LAGRGFDAPGQFVRKLLALFPARLEKNVGQAARLVIGRNFELLVEEMDPIFAESSDVLIKRAVDAAAAAFAKTGMNYNAVFGVWVGLHFSHGVLTICSTVTKICAKNPEQLATFAR
jgi:hypothetical protein